jgi:hypothetical protein
MIAQRRSMPSPAAAQADDPVRLASPATSPSRGPAQDAPGGARRMARLAAAIVGVLVHIAGRDGRAAVASHACCPRETAGLESIRC